MENVHRKEERKGKQMFELYTKILLFVELRGYQACYLSSEILVGDYSVPKTTYTHY